MGITNFLYNPERKDKQQLIDEFVIRQPVLDSIMEDLVTSPMQTPEQHYLIVGQRGTGKTTLLYRIRYAIEDSPVLRDWLIPVTFGEEQYNVGELANLWENIAEFLEDYHGFEGLSGQMEETLTYEDYEEHCWDILVRELDKKSKKLVLLIDNIGDLLKKIGEMEVRRLRRILQTKLHIRLVAGSPLYLESVLDYKQPLFEFFKVIRLESLSSEDARKLLLKLGEIHDEQDKISRIIAETPERIEVLRTLTGGVPRTFALMFNIFIEQEHENSIKDLERILDIVTPLYKHWMDDLPPQQQKIVDAVARHWDPIGVKDLKDRVRLEGKVISAQLRQLEKNQVVQKMATDTKNHEYILRERFFNIWYLMRYGRRDDRQRVIWLVKFLESWCTKEEIHERVSYFIQAVKANKVPSTNVDFFARVYTSLNDLNASSKFLLEESLPPKYGKDLQYSQDEITRIIEEGFAEGDYMRCFRIMLKVPELTVMYYEWIGQITFKIMENEELRALNDLTDLVISNLKGETNFGASFQIFSEVISLFTGCSIIFRLKENQTEEALSAMKGFLGAKGTLSLALDFEYGSRKDYFGFATILSVLRAFYKKGMIRSIKKIFEEGVTIHEKRKVRFSEMYNPIYLALNSLDPDGKKINLTPEKEGIVRAIVNTITSK